MRWIGLLLFLIPLSALSDNGTKLDLFSHLKGVRLIWSAQGELRQLAFPDPNLELADLGGVRSRRQQQPQSEELDPSNGQLAHWKGVVVSDLVDRVIATLPIEQRSAVDLIIFKDKTGQEVLIPRSLLNRYPILLASKRNGKSLDSEIPIIFPFRSKPKLNDEPFPLGQFSITQLVEIEISNYRKHFDKLLLTRQTDPAAVRGEKLFLQNCLSCHAVGRGPSAEALVVQEKIKTLEYQQHPNVPGAPKITPRDQRALINYLLTYQFEKNGKTAQK